MDHYHHGDLRRQLLDQAAVMAAESGPESVSLRELARRTGVSHSAPVHHFSTRRQLLTELASRGFKALNHELEQHGEDIYALGVAYVLWALEHPGEYGVMWQPHRLDNAGPELIKERERSWSLLSAATAAQAVGEEAVTATAYAAFSLVHGLTSLWLSGALPRPDNPKDLTSQITQRIRFDSAT